MTTDKLETSITILPWLRDHCFAGTPVLPAVESLVILAGVVEKQYPEVDTTSMTGAKFPRFLEIPAGEKSIDCVITLESSGNSTIRAGLYSRRKPGKFSRLVEHASVLFGDFGGIKNLPQTAFTKEKPFVLSGKKIYGRLVTFGPAYQNVVQAELFPTGASASLFTPSHCSATVPHGSPFLMDSAMHVACVWGQRFAGFVPFPVGFFSRKVVKPSQADSGYRVVLTIADKVKTELIVDMDLTDHKGKLVEQVRGLVMRDVSKGSMLPPDWIEAGDKGCPG